MFIFHCGKLRLQHLEVSPTVLDSLYTTHAPEKTLLDAVCMRTPMKRPGRHAHHYFKH